MTHWITFWCWFLYFCISLYYCHKEYVTMGQLPQSLSVMKQLHHKFLWYHYLPYNVNTPVGSEISTRHWSSFYWIYHTIHLWAVMISLFACISATHVTLKSIFVFECCRTLIPYPTTRQIVVSRESEGGNKIWLLPFHHLLHYHQNTLENKQIVGK